MSFVPLVNPQFARQRARGLDPWMPAPSRYAVVVLALVATCAAGYLTFQTFGQGAIAGCSGLDVVGCDEVLGSAWSKFLGMPVAVGGLVCYAAILLLSLAAGTRNVAAAPAINTALVMLTLLAVGSGIWFTSLQLIVVGKICPWCVAIHLCGVAVFALVMWSLVGNRSRAGASLPPVASAVGLSPAKVRSMPPALRAAAPIWSIASAGALAMLGVLVGGQILFPAKTYDVAKIALPETIEMTDGTNNGAQSTALSPGAQPHVVHRPESDETSDDEPINGGEPIADGESADEELGDDRDAAENSDATVPEDDAPPALTREVTFLDGKLKIDLYKQAVVGSREAPYVVLELLDYTCPHCRQMHENIKQAMRRYGDQLAVVIMPVPLELECNKIVPATDPAHRGSCQLSRLAMSVAAIKPSAFTDYHNWLLADKDRAPPRDKAILQAYRVVDRTRLSELTSSEEINNRIQRHIKLYSALANQQKATNKNFGLPVQIVGDTVLSGKVDRADELFEQWERAIDIRPR